MEARVWFSGTVLALTLFLFSNPAEAQAVNETGAATAVQAVAESGQQAITSSTAAPSQAVWNSAIGYVALVALLGIEAGVICRGFATPDTITIETDH